MNIFNYKKQPDDDRDLYFHIESPQFNSISLPYKYDLRDDNKLPPILTQGDLGSCTANASSNALRYCLIKENENVFQPSRLYIYYFSRLIEGTEDEDSGCCIRSVMKALKNYGACPEDIYPYDISKFKKRPSSKYISLGKQHIKQLKYLSINQDLDEIKNAIFQNFPIMCGIYCFETCKYPENLQIGNIPNPDTENEKNLGGHCVLLISYDDDLQLFTLMNSWGTSVGQHGYFTISYEYILSTDLAMDFWIIQYFV